jgi:hypothetical protein
MPKQHPINMRMIDHVVVRAAELSKMVDFYSMCSDAGSNGVPVRSDLRSSVPATR